jgi:NTP pyrophosphatase (non-canonical NTP hydrolase)
MNEQTREILLILQEECAEVTQAVSKCMRFCDHDW